MQKLSRDIRFRTEREECLQKHLWDENKGGFEIILHTWKVVGRILSICRHCPFCRAGSVETGNVGSEPRHG